MADGFDYLADLCKREMERQKLNATSLAERTEGNVSREQLSYWFNGKRKLGGSDQLAWVFWALNIEIGGKRPKKPG